jgi:hypothetical protein
MYSGNIDRDFQDAMIRRQVLIERHLQKQLAKKGTGNRTAGTLLRGLFSRMKVWDRPQIQGTAVAGTETMQVAH